MSIEDSMSGKPQFDESAVIAKAANVFWRHGYGAASVSDLTEATGLSRSSIYQRFGDKGGLFLEALQAYTERVLQRMNAAHADTARGRLEALLRGFLPDARAPQRLGGCLIARSCTEAADLSPAGQLAALTAATRQRDILVSILREAIQNGELTPGADIDALAWHYLGVLHAIVNFPYAGANLDTLHRMIDVAMAGWPTNGERAAH
jgi:TetR/AcrR family transcriptional regulator, copper-responsive repressor